jgi:hypothetical protein
MERSKKADRKRVPEEGPPKNPKGQAMATPTPTPRRNTGFHGVTFRLGGDAEVVVSVFIYCFLRLVPVGFQRLAFASLADVFFAR